MAHQSLLLRFSLRFQEYHRICRCVLPPRGFLSFSVHVYLSVWLNVFPRGLLSAVRLLGSSPGFRPLAPRHPDGCLAAWTLRLIDFGSRRYSSRRLTQPTIASILLHFVGFYWSNEHIMCSQTCWIQSSRLVSPSLYDNSTTGNPTRWKDAWMEWLSATSILPVNIPLAGVTAIQQTRFSARKKQFFRFFSIRKSENNVKFNGVRKGARISYNLFKWDPMKWSRSAIIRHFNNTTCTL